MAAFTGGPEPIIHIKDMEKWYMLNGKRKDKLHVYLFLFKKEHVILFSKSDSVIPTQDIAAILPSLF